MGIRPNGKFNVRGELYFDCPIEGCAWTFQTAVRYGNKSTPPAVEYVKQLNEEYGKHVKDAHSFGS